MKPLAFAMVMMGCNSGRIEALDKRVAALELRLANVAGSTGSGASNRYWYCLLGSATHPRDWDKGKPHCYSTGRDCEIAAVAYNDGCFPATTAWCREPETDTCYFDAGYCMFGRPDGKTGCSSVTLDEAFRYRL